MNSCYLCGYPAAPHSLELKKSFTAHSMARSPCSNKMCDRCYSIISGHLQQVAYWNEKKQAWSTLWSRNTSWLLRYPRELQHADNFPSLAGKQTVKGKNLTIISKIPSRQQIREWLINPPEPPFEIAIAQSGQKHILPFSQQSHSRNKFPVLFELDLLTLDREQFTELLSNYESLMAWFSKTEIDSGYYRSDRLRKAIGSYEGFESAVSQWRGSRLLELASFVARS